MKDKPVTPARNSDIRVQAMLDGIYKEHPDAEPALLSPGQAFPFWDAGDGYKWDTRLLLYTALGWKDQYYTTVKGECLSYKGASAAGREDALLGYGFGMREFRFKGNPPGVFCESVIDSNYPGVLHHPMKLRDFDTIAAHAAPSFEVRREIIPSIFCPSPRGAQESDGDKPMWTPDKGTILMRKTPLPVCITPFNTLLQSWGYNPEMLRSLASLYQGMIWDWCGREHVSRLYVGFAPSEFMEEHLVHHEEFSAKFGRTLKTVPYTCPDVFERLDIHRYELKLSMRNQTIGRPELFSGWL